MALGYIEGNGRARPQPSKRGFQMAPAKGKNVIRKISHYAFDPAMPSLAAVREFIMTTLEPFEMIRPHIPDIVSATHEACINSIVHNPDCYEMVDVTCRISEYSVVVEVADKGRGLKNVTLPPQKPSPTALAGRGLFIICSLMDSVEAESGAKGTLLRMKKSCSIPE